MYTYEIYYRIDTSEYLETQSLEVSADSLTDLHEQIKDIERKHTILHIKNLSL